VTLLGAFFAWVVASLGLASEPQVPVAFTPPPPPVAVAAEPRPDFKELLQRAERAQEATTEASEKFRDAVKEAVRPAAAVR
jgi:hypothetical protein